MKAHLTRTASWVSRLSVICSLVLAGASQHNTTFAQFITTVALSGDASPDGNGTFQKIGGTDAAFASPTINSSGQIVFGAGLTDAGGPNRRGVFMWDSTNLKKVARTGDPVPGGPGTFVVFGMRLTSINIDTTFGLNDRGHVVFYGEAATGTGVTATNNEGIYFWDGAAIHEVVREGQSPPDGNGTFLNNNLLGGRLGQHSLDASDRVTFFSQIRNTAGGSLDDTAIFRWEAGVLSQVLRDGMPAPGGNGSLWETGDPAGASAGGFLTVRQLLTGTTGGSGVDDEVVYLVNGAITEIARNGVTEVFPDGPKTIVGIGDDQVNDLGDVLYSGTLATPGMVDFESFLAVRRMSGGTTYYRPGHSVRTFSGGQVGLLKAIHATDFNNAGQFVFEGVLLEGSGSFPDNENNGVFLADGTNIIKLVMPGDPAPGGNGEFGVGSAGLSAVRINNRGQVLLASRLRNTANPGNDDVGIFLVDTDGTIIQVARAGQSLLGTTITESASLGGTTLLTLANYRSLNDRGQVAFTALLADGRDGVFIWGPPIIDPVARQGDDIVTGIQTEQGYAYQFQGRETLASGDWGDIGQPISGTGARIELRHQGAFSQASQHFYRVEISPDVP